MNRRGVWVLMLLMALLVVMPNAWGQRPPETHPVSATQNIVMSWDRSAMPVEIELWAPKTILAYSGTSPEAYGISRLVCGSSSDSGKGLCPTSGLSAGANGAGEIRLGVVEARSGMRTDIRLLGSMQRPVSGVSCFSDYWDIAIRPLWSAAKETCGRHQSAGVGVSLTIPNEELVRLVAGNWSATLVLDLQGQIAGPSLARYTFNFDFTITDRNAVSIYFPAFHNVTPLVQLNANYDPIGHTVGGRTVLDMCLYDGLGSQAEYLGVTVRDRGGHPPGPSGYSLWHTDGGTDDTRRLDYTVSLAHSGATVPMPNGVEQQLHGIDSAQSRLVLLPGMSQPVFCVPTPITFDIPRVPISTQQAGTYFGELQVELRVPTTTP
ncbi:MAG: CfaE/CblD family pilus tip adhesin [Stenotrophomonas indicatrix]|uniref:CfaE/CblD family pilus tip adhesin n=1 Tax=Stenotrophomonas indicatrix TaxID=2045451 RepID=UPI003C7A42EB